LVNDAPTFYQALGSSLINVNTIVADVVAVVSDGGGTRGNLFKVQIHR
jgi:hypothetical protein